MAKEKLYKYLVLGLIVFGGILRLTVFWVSPPNNAYDDHLEVINIYAQDFNRPHPFQCWECYQPPLYYYIGAAVYNTAKHFGVSQENSWKVVQGINPFLSIILLILAYQILTFFKLQNQSIALVLSFLVILPRDIFTAVMIGNDYLLVFCTITSLYLFLKILDALKSRESFLLKFGALIFVSFLGSLTKQHGLLLYLLPCAIVLLLFKKDYQKTFYWAILILVVGSLFSLSEELWKYSKTGILLVSNQDYFDYAKDQFPGALDKIEFFTFRIVSLYNEPFISESTSASFFTELFARTFHDYEWRFISPEIPWAKKLGRISYFLGLVWIAFYILILISWAKKYNSSQLNFNLYAISSKVIPVLLALLFVAVPFLQTFRYPYFSSMKSMFMLSGLVILLLIIGSLIREKSLLPKISPYIIALNVSYGVLLVISICLYIGVSLNHLHGPLWFFPE